MIARSTAPVALLALVLGALPAAAASARAAAPTAPETRLRYSVSLAGLPIARADLTLATAADHYDSRLVWRTSGLVDVFAGARGEVAASGRLGRRRPVPATYELASGEGRKAVHVMLAMAGGAVKAAEAEPPSKKAADLVPLEPRHRIDVLDPLSATLLAARSAEIGADDLCRRDLPIFDGWTRYDVRLSPKTTTVNRRRGVEGPIVVCAARWVPIAGHRTGAKVTRFMRDNEDLSVAFGRLEKADVWVPVEVSVRTMVGTARVELDTLTTTGFDAAATKPPTP